MRKIDRKDWGGDLHSYRMTQARETLHQLTIGSSALANFLENNDVLSDIIVTVDSATMLPKDRRNADLLVQECLKPVGESKEIADVINWIKIGDKWWLDLWWD